MKIGIITPAPPRSRYGNRVTAIRWARILKSLGFNVTIAQAYESEPWDLLIALHARRSYASASRFHREHPERPIVVALTGTDLYRDLPRSRRAKEALEIASRLVVLQPKAIEHLPARLHPKIRVIYQSVPSMRKRSSRRTQILREKFDVCVIGHLRPVKDPFRAAIASRRLPVSSRIRILHLGAAMDEVMARRARAEMKTNPRYRWSCEQPASRVWQVLRSSRLCVLSSRLEGGANVISEAVVAGTPLLASRIPGSVGLLGENYPGYFKVGDSERLAQLLRRAETDRKFLARLRSHCRRLSRCFHPGREKKAWKHLIEELRLR